MAGPKIDTSVIPGKKSNLIFHLAAYPEGRKAVKRIYEDPKQPEVVRLEAAAALAQQGDRSGVEYAKQIIFCTKDDHAASEASSVLYFAYDVNGLISLYNGRVWSEEVGRDKLLNKLEVKAGFEYRDNLNGLLELFKNQKVPLVKGTLGHQFWHVAGLDENIAVWEKETDLMAREWLLAAISTRIDTETRRENLEALSKRISHFEIQTLINKRLRGMDMAVPDRLSHDK